MRRALACGLWVMVGACHGEPPQQPAPAAPPALEADEPPEQAPPEPVDGAAEGIYREAMAARRAGRLAEAAAGLRRACDAEHAQACFKLAELQRDGHATPESPGETEELVQRACRGGSTAACDELGH